MPSLRSRLVSCPSPSLRILADSPAAQPNLGQEVVSTPRQVVSLSLAAALLLTLAPLAHGATLFVANNGVDGSGCGTSTSPCRSIGQGVANAAAGDSVVVGPGLYGDLNDNGILGETGEENPDVFSPGCGCVFALNKAVSLTSSNGAAATVIDARVVLSAANVLIITTGGEFGKPGKGFTVTNTATLSNSGVAIDGSQIKVEGNQVVSTGLSAGFSGIFTVVNNGEVVLIEGNQVIGWSNGISVTSAGKTVAKNSVSFNGTGIMAAGASVVVGNVASVNETGIEVRDAARAVGNAVYGNRFDGFVINGPFSGTLGKNNIFGNGMSGNCGLSNATVGVLAANNYWGAATGPGADPADDVCNVAGGTTTVTPFATKPFNVKSHIKP
jgi:hypothetical protein